MRFDPQRAIARRHAPRLESRTRRLGEQLSDSTNQFREILHWTFLLTISTAISIAIGFCVATALPLNGLFLLLAIAVGGVAAGPALLFTVPFLWGANRWRAAALVFPVCLLSGFWFPVITDEPTAPFPLIAAFLSLLACALCPWVKEDSEGTFRSRSALKPSTSKDLREGRNP